jgi:hypothetical protein
MNVQPSVGLRAHLRVLSQTIHFAQVPVRVVYGTHVLSGGYPQLRAGHLVKAVLMPCIPGRPLWINLWKLWIAIGNCWCCPWMADAPDSRR